MLVKNKNDMDLTLLITTLILLSIGVAMVFSASSVSSFLKYNDTYHYLKSQGLYAVVGITAMLILSRVDYKFIGKFAPALILGSLVLLIMVLIPGVGYGANGAVRWLKIGSFTLQPSEFAKFALIIFMARSLSAIKDKVGNFKEGVVPYIVLMGVYFGLIILEPNLSMAGSVVLITFAMLFAAGAKIRHLIVWGLLIVPVVVYKVITEPYMLKRVTSYMDPWADPLGKGYQLIQSLFALGSGGIFGLGLGNSRQKFFYIPEPQNDFIFSIIGEELGFIGTIMIVSLFIILIWRGLRIAIMCPDRFGSLLATGITCMIGIQTALNIMVATGLIPTTGVSLPLISSGGSSLLFVMCNIGILLNISKKRKQAEDDDMKAVLSGGGTGGHIYPAIAIAKELQKRDETIELLFVGTKKGLESTILPKEGYNLKTIKVRGFVRKLSTANITALKELLISFAEVNKILNEFKPDVVIGTGGFVCGSVLLLSALKGIPTIIHEQNAFAGMTNRLLSRFVSVVAVNFADAGKYFVNARKTIVTGNPIRKDFLFAATDSNKKILGFDNDLPLVLVVGGSRGAKAINECTIKMAIECEEKKEFQLLHITGDSQYDDVLESYREYNIDTNSNRIRVEPYLHNMPQALAASDLVISRCGAGALAEITALGKPSILIPYPHATDNHQEYNARALEKNSAAVVIIEKDLNDMILVEQVKDLLRNKALLNEMGQNSKNMAIIDASERIADEIEQLILKRKE